MKEVIECNTISVVSVHQAKYKYSERNKNLIVIQQAQPDSSEFSAPIELKISNNKNKKQLKNRL